MKTHHINYIYFIIISVIFFNPLQASQPALQLTTTVQEITKMLNHTTINDATRISDEIRQLNRSIASKPKITDHLIKQCSDFAHTLIMYTDAATVQPLIDKTKPSMNNLITVYNEFGQELDKKEALLKKQYPLLAEQKIKKMMINEDIALDQLGREISYFHNLFYPKRIKAIYH